MNIFTGTMENSFFVHLFKGKKIQFKISRLSRSAQSIVSRMVGICMSVSQGSLFDLQNSQSKLAAPREKKGLQWIMTVK